MVLLDILCHKPNRRPKDLITEEAVKALGLTEDDTTPSPEYWKEFNDCTITVGFPVTGFYVRIDAFADGMEDYCFAPGVKTMTELKTLIRFLGGAAE